MNLKFKELAKAAGLKQTKWADVETGVEPVRIWQESLNDPGALERFAMLIVQESMQCCDNVDNDDYDDVTPDCATGMRDGALLCKIAIKEQFGIEND